MTNSRRFSRKQKMNRRNKSRRADHSLVQLESLETRQMLTVLLADSFEVGEWNGNWVEDSQNDWARTSQRAADGSYAAEVDGSASNATLSLANPLDLASYGSAELTFSWYIESSFDSGEYIALDLYDGNSWNEVASLRGNVDQENTWHNETVTIDGSYLVSDFQLRYRAKVSDSREDGFVDNVKIEGTLADSQIAISDAQVLEGDGGHTNLVYTVSRSGNISEATTVDFATVAGTATEGVDYVGSSGMLTFPAGDSSSQTITVQVNGETAVEPDENLFVNLSNATGGTIADTQGTGTILDDDAVATISYSDFSDPTGLNLVRHATAPAGTNNALRLTPQLTSQQGAAWFASPQLLSVGFETEFEFQTAGDGSDGFAFVVQNSQDDALGGVGGGLGYKSIANSLAIEFDTFQNSETNDPNNNHVGVHTMGAAPNSNHESASLGTVTPAFDINDGNIHQVKVVYQPGTMAIFLDDFVSPALTVAVDLAETLDLDVGKAWVGFTGVSGGDAQSHDILSWEYSVLADVTTTIGVADAQAIEGDNGVTNLVFTVTRDGDTSGTAIVSGVIAEGTATFADGDYGTLNSTTLTFAAGQTVGTFVLPINGDQTPEEDETLTLHLTLDSGTAHFGRRGCRRDNPERRHQRRH
ncbi:MAG: Calx-beta domain-containing protein [Planctomycetaceae bacterium]